jgi:adenylate cyclase
MVDSLENWPAWLEATTGNRTPIRGSCSFGRSESNEITLQDQRVSRRHAEIQAQGDHEYWLVDFGSRNGSYVNGQRIAQPTRLRDGDTLSIGAFQYTFRQARSTSESTAPQLVYDQTLIDVRWDKCWLLVADIINSTKFFAEVPSDTLPLLTGRWLGDCRDVIETYGGRINQFLGDGFFAFWRDRERTEARIHEALHALRVLQNESHPAFRVAVHLGSVMLGGVSVGEEERISGNEVHFVFRMEKLAGSLSLPRLLSETACQRLTSLIQTSDVGRHPLHGFEGYFQFYAF